MKTISSPQKLKPEFTYMTFAITRSAQQLPMTVLFYWLFIQGSHLLMATEGRGVDLSNSEGLSGRTPNHEASPEPSEDPKIIV